MSEPDVCDVMVAICEWCLERDLHAPVDASVDEHWHIAVAKDEKISAGPEGGMVCELDPFTWAVWWNGWLAGMGDPYTGLIAAGGLANQETFLQALKKTRVPSG